MSLEIISGDQSHPIFKDWKPWLQKCSVLYDECLNEYKYQPFLYHEMEAVSLMLGAAHRSGYMALSESAIERGEKSGRSDMWMACNSFQYYFEFKRSAHNLFATKWGLAHSMDVAKAQLVNCSFSRKEKAVAGVISATAKWRSGYLEMLRSFADEVDYAIHFGPDRNHGAYLFLNIMDT